MVVAQGNEETVVSASEELTAMSPEENSVPAEATGNAAD